MLSGILIVMVFMSGLITICPAAHKGFSDIHFIADECDNHHCSRNFDPAQCENENCKHQLCIDQPVSENFRPSNPQLFDFTSATLVSIDLDHPFTNISPVYYNKYPTFTKLLSLRTTVLRI